ncbi:riboflavin synthase [Stenomitos frigidus]|uniref:Riboflavin synthase n=1 Tax=Stenomitos frigidus ULC18 TaxID=2107698 RepID=A0A2T1EIU1_9CYAN|nr:riboflavin synthase [Stenomitos frigidus]PSB32667.1 riboflavin synthase [Stenomitos frigidus ULC18]
MFTGLVQGLGTLQSLGVDKLRITCLPAVSGLIMQDLEIGDSVAVDGVCLTVVELLPQGFLADASPETRDRSSLGQEDGTLVNLETSLKVGSKLGGHFVTGHVDGTGQLQGSVQTATSWEMTFTTNQTQVARYIIPKGSIAVNGISLTIADCDPAGTWFTVAVIPHTYAETNLNYLRPGSTVNLEGDILGKYVEKFLRHGTSSGDSRESLTLESLTPTFLAEHGYF